MTQMKENYVDILATSPDLYILPSLSLQAASPFPKSGNNIRMQIDLEYKDNKMKQIRNKEFKS